MEIIKEKAGDVVSIKVLDRGVPKNLTVMAPNIQNHHHSFMPLREIDRSN